MKHLETILAAVYAQPDPPLGKSKRQLMQECQAPLTLSGFEQNLQKLRKMGKIYCCPDPHHRNRFLWFPGTSSGEEEPANLLEEELSKILHFLSNQKFALPTSQIMRACGLAISCPSFDDRLERLERMGKIRRRKDPGKKRWLWYLSSKEADGMFEELMNEIEDYYDKRELRWPNKKDSLLWLMTEVGELVDSVLRTESGWVRNNQFTSDARSSSGREGQAPYNTDNYWCQQITQIEPAPLSLSPIADPSSEVADCLMMLLVSARNLGVDPVEALMGKMKQKLEEQRQHAT